MRTIQEVGTEIMRGTPRNFYIMTGSEYGVKRMYIQYLRDHYQNYKEADSVDDLLTTMSTKHFVPLQPTVYVVRYDENFVSTLNDKTSSRIRNTNIVGTIVCLYESSKHSSKVEKYLGDYTVHIEKVNDSFIKKYLKKDFPQLEDTCIEAAVESCNDWYEAEQMCRCMLLDLDEHRKSQTKQQLKFSFGKVQEIDDRVIKIIVASRDFNRMLYLVDKREGEEDSILYSILSTMLELEKISNNKYAESELRTYLKQWTMKDIYNMFMQTYQQLKYLRSISPDSKNVLIYLATLMQFSEIPSVEVLS